MEQRCIYCNRMVLTGGGRYKQHALTAGGRCPCPLVGHHHPITGTCEADYEARARIVLDLADQVQDRDPHILWTYLTALPADELQRLLVISLAGMNIADRRISEVFGWVTNLPAAVRA